MNEHNVMMNPDHHLDVNFLETCAYPFMSIMIRAYRMNGWWESMGMKIKPIRWDLTNPPPQIWYDYVGWIACWGWTVSFIPIGGGGVKCGGAPKKKLRSHEWASQKIPTKNFRRWRAIFQQPIRVGIEKIRTMSSRPRIFFSVRRVGCENIFHKKSFDSASLVINNDRSFIHIHSHALWKKIWTGRTPDRYCWFKLHPYQT